MPLDREGEAHVGLAEDYERPLGDSPSTSAVISDVDQWDEGHVDPVQRIRETALVALWRQGHVADDQLPVGFETSPVRPPLPPSSLPSSSSCSDCIDTFAGIRKPISVQAPSDKRCTSNRGARIRTGDLGHPKAARYQAAPRPDLASVERGESRREPLAWRRWPTYARSTRCTTTSRWSGRCEAVAAPPYDVIDAAGAGGAAGALALQRGRDRPAETLRLGRPGERPEGDPYERAARTIDAWRAEGALVAGRRAGDLGDDPGLHRARRHTHSRHGILARVRVEDYDAGSVRPHERTLPGPRRTGSS